MNRIKANSSYDRRDYGKRVDKDVIAIAEAIKCNGYEMSKHDAFLAWADYSDSVGSMWVNVPNSTQRILEAILNHANVEIEQIEPNKPSEYISEWQNGGKWNVLYKRKHFVNAKDDVLEKRKTNPHIKTRITEFGKVVFELDCMYKVEWIG